MAASAIVPPPPYTYDDPRFIYDEPCMFYDGGFDLVCLTNLTSIPKKLGGSSSTSRTLRTEFEKECETVIKIDILISMAEINGKQVPFEKVDKKYHLKYKPITVSVEDIKTEKNIYNVSMDSIISKITVPRICTNSKVKLLPIKTIVSSSLEARIRNKNILVSRISTKDKK